MRLRPISLAEAKEFVRKHHRHNLPPLSWKFGTSIAIGGERVGVAIAGRPVGRGLDTEGAELTDDFNIEILRVCVVETKNGNSRLYGAICRAAAALGYDSAYTYTLQSESGSSLKAAGFVVDEMLAPRKTWDTPSRRRTQTNMFGEEMRPEEAKIRWVKLLQSSPAIV